MDQGERTREQVLQELAGLRQRLEEAEEALRAIQQGEVDALVIQGADGDRVFTLQGAEHPYRVLVETINEGAATLTANGILLYSNHRLAEMLGAPLEKLLGGSLLPYITPEDQVRFEAIFAQGLERRSRGEVRFRRRDGTSLPVMLSMSWAQVEQVRGVCLIATDLSDQKRSEELLAAEKLARSILEQAAEAIIVVNPEGAITHASLSAHRLAGTNSLLKPFDLAFPLQVEPAGGPGQTISIRPTLETGQSLLGQEAWLESGPDPRAASSGRRYFLVSAAPLRSRRGEILGAIVTLTDVTLRKQNEENLAYQSLVLRSVNDAVIATDQDLCVTAWNPAAEQMYGWPAVEALGRPAEEIIPGEFSALQSEAARELLARQDFITAELVQQDREGRRHHVEGKIIALRGPEGQIRGYVAANRDMTEHFQLVQQIEAERSYLNTVIQQLPYGVLIAEAPGGKLIMGNQAAARIWGTPDIQAGSISEYSRYPIFHLDGRTCRPEEWPLARSILQGELVIGQELWFERADGARRVMSASSAPLYTARGELQAAVVVFYDITERKEIETELQQAHAELQQANLRLVQANLDLSYELAERERAEEALQAANLRLADTLESITDAYIAVDREWRFLGLNPAAERLIFHRPAAELLGKTFPEILPGFEQTEFHSQYQLAFQAGAPVHFEAHSILVDRWFEAHAYPRGERLEIYLRDITHRRQAEQHARFLDEISQSLAEAGLDEKSVAEVVTRFTSEAIGGVCTLRLVSPDRRYLDLASVYHPDPQARAEMSAFMRAFRLPLDSALNEVLHETVHPVLLTADSAGREGQPVPDEFRPWVERYHFHHLLKAPLRAQVGVIGSLGLARTGAARPFTLEEQNLLQDIASRAALAITNTHLFQDVQRELELREQAEAALKIYTVQLARSNRELQDFASIVSHDLQEPLRKIQSFGERLKNRYQPVLGEEGQDYITRMQSAAYRMHTMLNDLLAYSRVTTKGQSYVRVRLDKIVAEVLTDLEVRLEESGGQVTVEALPEIDADPLQMRQLFQNLIGNALKFHQDGVAPQVRVFIEEDNGAAVSEAVTLVVEDNGIGFDDKYVDRIFQPFQRLHGQQEYKGSGIGLAICRKIVERHGGSIGAHGQPGAGARFTVRLPVRQS